MISITWLDLQSLFMMDTYIVVVTVKSFQKQFSPVGKSELTTNFTSGLSFYRMKPVRVKKILGVIGEELRTIITTIMLKM